MKTVFHKSETRGYANHDWLEARHSFSFASWYNPERTHFGVLRVFNDDIIAGGKGFGTHPHDNMEIITIPIEGDLAHKDSMGNGTVIKSGDIQVMSAGTGILHSEFNANEYKACKVFQIWLFPNQKDLEPRYDQLTLDVAKMKNNFAQILSPSKEDEGVWIHQNAWFSMGEFDGKQHVNYQLKNVKNGAYIFLISGKIKINGQVLEKRDAFGIWDVSSVEIEILENSKILLLDVPMDLN